jgi:endonuclease/exonuclease/phosphatase family metal-dependent hydrolase
MQEVIRIQNDDMKNHFPDFMSFGFDGPDMDAYPEGYHGIAKNVILVSRKRYDFIASGNYWLSETPLIAGSKSWDTARARHCNWMRLKDKNTEKVFRILNTHLDHISQDAREKQIQVILDESRQYAADFPQILAGDFNSGKANEVHKKIRDEGWLDIYSSLHEDIEAGATTHGFLTNSRKQGGHRIDFIYSKGPFKLLASEIIKDDINGKFPSDHDFIYADVLFP